MNSNHRCQRGRSYATITAVISALPFVAGLALVLVIAKPATAQTRRSSADRFLDDWAAAEIGKGIGRNAAEAIRSASDFVSAGRDFTREIQTARQRFWTAYPSGSGRAQAEAEFSRELDQKDLYHLIIGIPEGSDGVRVNFLNRLGPVDGGIRPPARPEFEKWVDAIRKNLGARRPGDMVIPSPATLARAVEATRPQYEAYKDARDWAEFDAAGREPDWVKTPKGYVQMLLRRYSTGDRQKAEEIYSGMVEVAGENRLLEAAQKIRRAPKNKVGDVANVEPLGFIEQRKRARNEGGREIIEFNDAAVPEGLSPVRGANPYTILRASITTGDPRRYLTGQIILEQQNENWPRALKSYQRWVAAFGEQPVLDVAGRVSKATKRMDDGGIKNSGPLGVKTANPYQAFLDILAKKDPRGYVRAMVAQQEGLDSEIHIRRAYDKLASTYGEPKLLRAAGKVTELWETPRHLWPKQFEGYNRNLLAISDYKVLLAILESGEGSFATSDPDVVDNPVYISWAKFRPGARVSFLNRSLPARGRQPASDDMSVETTTRLKSLDSEGVLTGYTEKIIRGRTVTPSSRGEIDQAYPAKARKEWLEKSFSSSHYILARVYIENSQDSGVETIVVNGRSLSCHRYQLKPYRNNVQTVWVSDEVPGGVVRVVDERTVGRSTVASERILLSFDAIHAEQSGVRSEVTVSPPPSRPKTTAISREQNSFAPGLYVTTETASVRSGPGANFEVVAEIRENTRVHVVGIEVGWLRVESRQGNPPGYIPVRSARQEIMRR